MMHLKPFQAMKKKKNLAHIANFLTYAQSGQDWRLVFYKTGAQKPDQRDNDKSRNDKKRNRCVVEQLQRDFTSDISDGEYRAGPDKGCKRIEIEESPRLQGRETCSEEPDGSAPDHEAQS